MHPRFLGDTVLTNEGRTEKMSDDQVKMNLWRRFEAVVKPQYIVAAFVVLVLVGFCHEARAEVEPGVQVELGVGFLSGDYSEGQALLLTETFANKYSIGIGVFTEQWVVPRTEPLTRVPQTAMVQAYRNVRISENFGLGLGVAYWNGTSRAVGSEFTFSLLIRYEIGDHATLNFRHWSSAGSGSVGGSRPPNMGQDLFTFGWSF